MSHRLIIGLLTAGLAACSSPDATPPSCKISTKVTLPSSALTTGDDLQIQRAGEGFFLRSAWPHTRWARSSKLGELGPIVESPVEGYLGLGTVGKSGPADQIVAVTRQSYDQVVATAIDEQTGLPGQLHEVLTAVYHGQVVQVQMASSLDGLRAIYAHGNRVIEDPQAIVLEGDAERRGDPIVVKTGPDHDWDCLDVIPTATAAAVSIVETRNERLFWRVVEPDAEGTQVFESSVDVTEDLDKVPVRCPDFVAVTKRGFAALVVASNAPPIVFAVDRATFATDGATKVSLSLDEEPEARPWAIAAMGGGYAGYFTGGAEGSKPIRFFDASGQPLAGGIDPPAGIDVANQIHSTAGSLLLSFREGDGTRGWVDVTCGDE